VRRLFVNTANLHHVPDNGCLTGYYSITPGGVYQHFSAFLHEILLFFPFWWYTGRRKDPVFLPCGSPGLFYKRGAMKNKKDPGFTFMETIIVITIILILSAGVGFSAVKFIERARLAACKNQIESFRLSLQSYFLDCGVYPTEGQGLAALWEKPILAPVPSGWNGPYLDRQLPKDPWGNDYRYRNPGDKNLPFTIISFGADSLEGGEGQNADIYSWE
jgi:general secretion pathway protein G